MSRWTSRVLRTLVTGTEAGGSPMRFPPLPSLPSLPSCGPTHAQIERWQGLSPAERLASQHYWRAKRWKGGKPNGFWTARQWERLCARVHWRCAYCGTPTEQLSPDHIQPLAHGGTNDFANIAPVCMDCQRHKGSTPAWQWFAPDEFDDLMAWLHPEAA